MQTGEIRAKTRLFYGAASGFADRSLVKEIGTPQRGGGSRPGRIMSDNEPRHARHSGKRHQVADTDAVAIVIGMISLLIDTLSFVAAVITTLATLGVIGPAAGHPVAPASVVVCYGGQPRVDRPVVNDRSLSP